MTTSHELAAMSDEQFTHHLLRQAIETQIADMRGEADHMDHAGLTTTALALRRNADRLADTLDHNRITS